MTHISRATLEQLTEEHARRAALEANRQHIAEKFLTDEEANLLTNMRFVLEQFADALLSSSSSSEREQELVSALEDAASRFGDIEAMLQAKGYEANYARASRQRIEQALASSGIAVPAAPDE